MQIYPFLSLYGGHYSRASMCPNPGLRCGRPGPIRRGPPASFEIGFQFLTCPLFRGGTDLFHQRRPLRAERLSAAAPLRVVPLREEKPSERGSIYVLFLSLSFFRLISFLYIS